MEKEFYLLNNRQVNRFSMGFSLASSWIWAPSLIVSAQKAYSHGLIGALAFLIPNVLTLIIFSYFAKILKGKYPNGITFTNIILEKYRSRKVYNLYLFQHFTLQILCLSVQLLAGGKLLNQFFHLNFLGATTLLAFLPLTYVYFYGLTGSIISDFIKLSILILFSIGISLMTLSFNHSEINLPNGLWGLANKSHHFFNKCNIDLFFEFIIPSTLGLISGPFGDQAFYQRTFAVKENYLIGSFKLGALLFAIVPLSMSLLGMTFASLQTSFIPYDFPHIELVSLTFGKNISILFILVLLLALASAIDNHYSALSCLGGHDLYEDHASLKKYNSVGLSRITMIGGGILAIFIANIPHLQIVHLFLIYGTLRGSTILVTIGSVLDKKWNENLIFWGLITSIFICLPVFIWANLNKKTYLISLTSLATIFIPYLIIKGFQFFSKEI